MKNLMVIAALAFSCCMVMPVAVHAQSSTDLSDNGNGKKDYMLMQNGKVMLVRNGQSVPITVEWTLKDGEKVQPDGTVTGKNGKKWTLKEGEIINMHGGVKK